MGTSEVVDVFSAHSAYVWCRVADMCNVADIVDVMEIDIRK